MAKDVVVGDGTTEKSASEVWVGTTGGNKQATEVWVGTATGNKQVWPSLTAPAAPTGVSATEIDYDTIRVEWNLSATATGYRVFRSNDGSTGWAQVGGDLGPTIDLYDDNGLPEGVQRYYKVRAFNDAGESPDSTIVNNWTTLRAPNLLSLAASSSARSSLPPPPARTSTYIP